MSAEETAQEEWVLENQEAQEEQQPSDVEALAAELGWKPQDQWKGPKEGWTPAADYIRTTHKKFQDTQERVKDTERRARSALRQRDEEFAERMERLERTNQVIWRENEARIRDEARQYYESEKFKAAKEGDAEKYGQLDREQIKAERELDKRFKEARGVDENAPDPNVQAQAILKDPITGPFFREHPWVAEDDEAYEFSFAVAQDLAERGFGKAAQIREVKAALKDRYPERFGQPTRQSRQTEEDGHVEHGEEAPRDEQGRFVSKQDAPFVAQQRKAPILSAGTRTAMKLTPEQEARSKLPPEAVKAFEEQKASGRFKGDIVRFAKIYNGEQLSVLD